MSNYKLFLPKTSFPLKRKNGVEDNLLSSVCALPSSDHFDFLLHDGPPYANGNLHLGHFLNKVLKDVNNRYYSTFHNKQVSFRPGWDCHGLPVEWKVEEQYSKNGLDKNANVLQFRKDCRQYAKKWVEVQKEEFKSFGVMADWDNCYTTQDYSYEAKTLENFLTLQEKGWLEHRFRPVWWSPVEKTTLAEAELEHVEMPQASLFVEFPVEGEDYGLLVWTTTPWTLPGNKAVAFNSDASYVLVQTAEGTKLVTTLNFFNCFYKVYGFTFLNPFDPNDLKGKFVVPPFQNNKSPLLEENEAVNEMAGSGFLHVVPGHGFVDFELGVKNGLSLESLVDDDAMMTVNGQRMHVYKANQAVYDYLTQSNLFHVRDMNRTTMQEVSWRSKKPVLVKTKKNWFFDFSSFKDDLLAEVKKVDWNGLHYQNRFESMLHGRSEWCLSRQRLWGVPLAVFLHKETGEMLVDKSVNENLVSEFEKNGSDVWYEYDADHFLPAQYHGQYDKVMDVLDVWFDSGSSLKAVYPSVDQADLYVEGTDQHRGWFQSSALLHYGLYGIMPYKQVHTHGFVQYRGNKLSKSAGDGESLSKLMSKYGPDVLRMWVTSSMQYGDVEYSEDRFDQAQTSYDKVRNTLRFCFSNLENQTVDDAVELRPMDRYVLLKTKELLDKFQDPTDVASYKLVRHCNWLSKFYFAKMKDALYCESEHSLKRKAVLKTLDKLSKSLLLLASPFVPFLVAEAANYGFRPSQCLDDVDFSNLGYWEFVEDEMEEVEKAFEQVRQLKGWTMEQTVVTFNSLLPVDWKEVLGCADVYHPEQIQYTSFDLYEGLKCLRCRTYCATVNADDLCQRCEDVENEYGSSV